MEKKTPGPVTTGPGATIRLNLEFYGRFEPRPESRFVFAI